MSDQIDKKQKLLLEYLFSNQEVFIKAYSVLKDSYFESPLDKVVRYVKGHFTDYHTLPDVDIIDAETGITLKYRPIEPTDVQYVLDEVEDHCQRSAMTEAVLAGADMINEGDVSGIQALIREALMVKIDTKLGTDLFEDPRTRIENSGQDMDERALGCPGLDVLMGNVRRCELAMFVAGTGIGKSVTLGNIANWLSAQKLDTVIISVEMNEDRYSMRLDSLVAGTPLKNSEVDDVVAALEAVKESYGRITTKRVNNKFGCEDLRTFIMEYHLRHGKYPDVLILDYIDIFSNGNIPRGVNGKFEWDEVKTHTVRDICEEFNMYGFTASQTNRSGYGGVTEIGVEHMGGGLSKAQGADTIIALVATEEDLENNTWTAKPLKLRNENRGEIKPLTLYRCPKTLRISDKPFIGKQSSPVIKKTKEKPNLDGKSGKDKLKQALSITGGLK